MDTAEDSEALFWSHSGDYHCEYGALGTYCGLPIIGLYSHIQQQRLGVPVQESPEITALIGDGIQGVDKDRRNRDGVGTSNGL